MSTPALGMILENNLGVDNFDASLRALMVIASMPFASAQLYIPDLT